MPRSKPMEIELGSEDFRADVSFYSGPQSRREGCLADIRRYGDWHDDDTGRFLIPGKLSGSGLSASLAAQSNVNSFRKEFPRGELVGTSGWWREVGGGHGTFAVVIDLMKVPPKQEKKLKEFLYALEEYVVADDSEYSRLETEAQEEAWNDWAAGDFKRALQAKFDFEFDEVEDGVDSKLFDLFMTAGQRAQEFWHEESDGSMFIDVKRIVERGKITEAEIDALDATFVEEDFEDDVAGFYILYGQRPRRSEEEVFESFDDAEEEAWDIVRLEERRGVGTEAGSRIPPVEIVEAESRTKALRGQGHVWWRDGVKLGPPTDPRQGRFAFQG